MSEQTHMLWQNRILVVFFPLVLAVMILGLGTEWSFNVFEPQLLWKGYNYYFLSLLDGRLDVPTAAIGKEGSYIGGKAYMYYGLLPTIPRLLLHPFVDLSTTPASLFSIFFFTYIGCFALQFSINKLFLESCLRSNSTRYLVTWLGLTLIVWIGSASFVISQNGSIYHEPYAAALALLNVYVALLIRDDFFLSHQNNNSLIPYAILAALAVHSRMPTALALYLFTGLLIIVQGYRLYGIERKYFNLLRYFQIVVREYWLPLIILAIGGFSILVLNYAKYGDAMAFMGKNYGYFFLEGFSQRACNLTPTSDYARFLRLVPNTYIYLTGDSTYHWSLTWHLQTGFGRVESPSIPLLALWPLPILCLVLLVFTLIKSIRKQGSWFVLLSLLMISAGALYQLSYPTITHRYSAELWAPLLFATVFVAHRFVFSRDCPSPNKSWLGFCTVLLSIGIAYQLYLATTEKYYIENGPMYQLEDFHYSEEEINFLRELTDEKIVELRKSHSENKKVECAKMAEKAGLSDLLNE